MVAKIRKSIGLDKDTDEKIRKLAKKENRSESMMTQVLIRIGLKFYKAKSVTCDICDNKIKLWGPRIPHEGRGKK